LAVLSQNALILQCREWKRNGKRVVLVTGRFDLLHPGHIRLLEQAHSHGDFLAVALESDSSIRTGGDLTRPVTPEGERAELLDALEAVDCVAVLEDQTPSGIIAQILPDVVATGATGARQGSQFDAAALEAAGSKLLQIPPEPGYSTERLIERIGKLTA
jgi:D-beta-D-heptose 7-phosphate kinase/D-beta-D-heptose 1-phosphate adenosyltransferase